MYVNGILLFVLLLSILYVSLSIYTTEGFTWNGNTESQPLKVNESCGSMCERNCLTQPECDEVNTRCSYIYNDTDKTCECQVQYVDMYSPDLNYELGNPALKDSMDLATCNDITCDSVFKGLPINTAQMVKNNVLTLRTEEEINDFRSAQEKIVHGSTSARIEEKYLPCERMDNPDLFGNEKYVKLYGESDGSWEGIPDYWRFRPGTDVRTTPYHHWRHIGIHNNVPFIDKNGQYCNNKEAAQVNKDLIRASKVLEEPVNFFVLPEMAYKKLNKVNTTLNKVDNQLKTMKAVLNERGMNV